MLSTKFVCDSHRYILPHCSPGARTNQFSFAVLMLLFPLVGDDTCKLRQTMTEFPLWHVAADEIIMKSAGAILQVCLSRSAPKHRLSGNSASIWLRQTCATCGSRLLGEHAGLQRRRGCAGPHARPFCFGYRVLQHVQVVCCICQRPCIAHFEAQKGLSGLLLAVCRAWQWSED